MAEYPCSRCNRGFPVAAPGVAPPVTCPRCGAALEAVAFPALWRGAPRGGVGERLASPDGAGCFHHQDRAAVSVCEGCGRFLCALCDVEFMGQRLCPGCIEAGYRKETFRTLDARRTRYGSLALALAVLPILAVWPTVLTAPAALFVVFRFWRAPGRLAGSEHPQMVLAAILAVLQLAGWGALAIALAVGRA